MKPLKPPKNLDPAARAAPSTDPDSLPGLPGDSLWLLGKSLKKQWKSYRKVLKECQGKLTEKAIHELRVGARRLISTAELLQGALSVQRIKQIERALKQHLDAFDELRDTQVQLPMIARMQRTFPAALPFYAYLIKREARFAKSARKRIRRVRTRSLGRLIAACRSNVEACAKARSHERACAGLLRAVQRAHSRTLRLRSRIDPRRTRTIHQTRIAFKHFRYMVETLTSYLRSPNRPLLRALHDYQTMMGEIQDAEVVLEALDRYLEKHKLPPEPVRHLREELVRRRQNLIEVYLGAAGQLDSFWPWPRTRTAAKVPDFLSRAS